MEEGEIAGGTPRNTGSAVSGLRHAKPADLQLCDVRTGQLGAGKGLLREVQRTDRGGEMPQHSGGAGRRKRRRMTRYVAYLRVSTQRQGASGLGLEAQREAVARHAATAGGTIVAEVVETESGKRDDRPELAQALAACRAHKATLLIAKLDRLARDVAF